jgi:hypothetical protein
MVEYFDVDQLQGVAQSAREIRIRGAWFTYPGRVVVREDDGRGIEVQDPFNDFTRMDYRAVDGSFEQGFEGNHAMSGIEEDRAKHLTRAMSKLRDKEAPGGSGVRDW